MRLAKLRLEGMAPLFAATVLAAGILATAAWSAAAPGSATPTPAPTAAGPAAAPATAPSAPSTYYSVGIEPPAMENPALRAVSLLKLALLLAFAATVFYVIDWAMLDTRFVNTSRALWGGIVLGGGAVGLAAALVIPVFYFGLSVGAVVFAGAAIAYATHRNGLVTDPLKVLTRAHLVRIRRRLAGKKAVEAPGPVAGAGRDIIFMGLDDLPIRLSGTSQAERQANAEVERVLFDAITRRATAVGFLERPGKGEIRFRIDGEMVPWGDVDRPAADHFAAAIKRMAGLDPDEKRKPQEGRFRAVVAGQTFDVRVKTAGTVRGEQVAIRIIDLAAAHRRLDDLGLSVEGLLALKDALTKRPALVVLSSPKDSGLTTTLQACMRNFDRYVNNCVLFEPRTDVEIENVQHVVINQEDGPVAAAEVRSRVHMEPDVVGFDSVYATEVAQVLAEAAEQRTVLVGIRAADTTQAIARLAGLLGTRDPLARNLQLVVCQRLVRLLCPDCKEAYRPNPEFLRKANLGNRRVDVLYRPPTRVASEQGKTTVCPRCHNDRYVGRTGLFEVMPIDDEARSMIAQGASPTDLRTYARKIGMRNLQEEGLELVIAGHTSIEEVLRVIRQEA